MVFLNKKCFFSILLVSTFSSKVFAEVILDFNGLNKNQQVVNATLVLKDSYQLGASVSPGDVASYRLFDVEGEKDSSNNWQLKNIQAVVNTQGELEPTANGTSLVMYNQFDSTIFYLADNGRWDAIGGGPDLSGTSGKWTMRQNTAQNQQASVTPQNCTNGDRFHKAAARGNVKYVQDCLTAGIAVDVQEGNGWTALHAAARQGQIAVIDTLLRYNANPNIRDKTGRTPLDQATLAKQQKAIDILSQQVPPSPIAGGGSEAALNDPSVLKAARFAAAALARYRPDSMTSPYLHSVVKAGKQVVAGTNYYLTLKTNDTDVYTWEVVVYEDLQGGLRITESKQTQ